MEWLYLACIVLSGTALVVITLIIPLGVFMRYVMNSPLSWPEPASVIMMVMFSFLGGAAVYRANVHIAVEALLNAVTPGDAHGDAVGRGRLHGRDRAASCSSTASSCASSRGTRRWRSFPALSQAVVYLPIPVARPVHAAVPHRAGLGRRSAEDVDHVPRPGRRSSSSMDVLVLLGSFALLCALGVPVAYALGLAALVAAMWIDIPLEAVMLKISDGTDDFALLAIPFFVLAGGIMAEGGMATRLINLARVFVGFIRGGLALVNILASTLFGCISGSSVADTASIGSVMIPQMVKAGYPARLRHQRHDLRLGAGAA